MAGKKEDESSRRKLTDQKKASHKEQPGSRPDKHELVPSTEQEVLSADFWNEFIKRASIPPIGEDTAFWPISMLIDFKSVIRNREYIRNQKKREYVEKLVPLEETIRKVDTAYKSSPIRI